MPKKQQSNSQDNSLLQAINEIQQNNPEVGNGETQEVVDDDGVVDIITFCNSPKYLNLPANNLNLWLPQKIILKTFYMGTMGNKHVELDKEEWEWLESHKGNEERDGVAYERNIDNVLDKILRKQKGELQADYFSELQLVLGRRSSKTLMASIITVYEAYKLLVINDGDPHGYYNLPHGSEIAIINVALSQQQAGRLFGEVRSRLRTSPFFANRIAHPTGSSVHLLTDYDMKLREQGSTIEVDGSILLLCGHSNADSLAGYNVALLLFDEIAFFDESGKVTGKMFYERLTPSLAKFFEYNGGRVVQISSPNSRMGIFYETFENSTEEDAILSFHLPTWNVNEDISYENYELRRARKRNLETFAVEYGAQWASGGTIGKFFEEGLVDRCIRHDIDTHTSPVTGFNYYLHVDPAKGGNNYSAVLVAAKHYTNTRGQRRTRCYLANLWVWRPSPNVGLQFHLIDRQVIQICKLFNPIIVSYDAYQSAHSIQVLKSNGINTREISYNRGVKEKIYRNLKLMMGYEPEPELFMYDDGEDSSLLISELRSLRFKRIQRGISIVPDKHGDVPTDDLADCLAGACAMANTGITPELPSPVLVRTGFS